MGLFGDFRKLIFGAKAITKSAADKTVEKGKELAEDALEKGKDVGAKVLDKADDVFDKTKAAVTDVADKVRDKADDIWEKLKETTENISEKTTDVVEDKTDKKLLGGDANDSKIASEIDDAIFNKTQIKKQDIQMNHLEEEEPISLKEQEKKLLSDEKTSPLVDDTPEKLNPTLEKAKDMLEGVGSKVLDASEKVGEKVAEKGSEAWEKMKDLSEKVGDQVLEKGGQAFDAWKSVVGDAADKLKGKAQNLWDKAQEAAEKGDEAFEQKKPKTKEEQFNELLRSAEDLEREAKAKAAGLSGKIGYDDLKKSELEDKDDFFSKAAKFADGNYDSTKPNISQKPKSGDSKNNDDLVDDAILDES